MKFSAAIVVAATLGFTSARSVSQGPPDRVGDAEEVAGPMTFTNCGTPTDTAIIDKIELIPNPPEFGKPLTIKATGELKKDMEAGTKLKMHITSGIFSLDKSFDVCDMLTEYKDKMSGGSIQCPVKAAKKTWEQTVNLPDFDIPKFVKKINVAATVKNKDGSQVACQNVNWVLR